MKTTNKIHQFTEEELSAYQLYVNSMQERAEYYEERCSQLEKQTQALIRQLNKEIMAKNALSDELRDTQDMNLKLVSRHNNAMCEIKRLEMVYDRDFKKSNGIK